MFSFLRDWLDQRIIQRSAITPSQWDEAYARLPLLNGLTQKEKQRLRELAILFLDKKTLEGARGLEITQAMALIIALQACLPILNLSLEDYDGWVAVIIYPAAFYPKRKIMDENGVVHHVESDLAGESWQRGPVILAWDETEQAGIIDGQNLVIHEFAHKLDMQNGEANGYPPLHSEMDRTAWVRAFTAGFEDFRQKCIDGVPIGINCYGASSPAEYFAVLSEVFFERPDILGEYYKDIYELLRKYYRQDPYVRLGH
jgi:Mlc titration factor MtfA (ptsG expression regulator)